MGYAKITEELLAKCEDLPRLREYARLLAEMVDTLEAQLQIERLRHEGHEGQGQEARGQASNEGDDAGRRVLTFLDTLG